jgi:pyruvate,orthophosphate dikinase
VLLNEGDMLALDGNTGAVHAGELTVTTERPDAALQTISAWQRAALA